MCFEKLRQQDIAVKLNCGVATITRVSRCLKDEKNFGYINSLKKLFPGKQIHIKNSSGVKNTNQ
ncbi:MAG: trp operon repressor [Rickettsiales bacterium]|nr:trp operon repressor [Rickettsiales bacterium]